MGQPTRFWYMHLSHNIMPKGYIVGQDVFILVLVFNYIPIWAMMQERLSSGFLIRLYQKQPAQLQRLARIVKILMEQVLI